MWVVVLYRKMIQTGASILEFHRRCMFSDDKSCCAGLAEFKKWSLIFPKSFVVVTKPPPIGSKKMPGYIKSVLNAAMKRICFIKA